MAAGGRAEKCLCRVRVARRYAGLCDQTASVRWKHEKAGCEQCRYTLTTLLMSTYSLESLNERGSV